MQHVRCKGGEKSVEQKGGEEKRTPRPKTVRELLRKKAEEKTMTQIIFRKKKQQFPYEKEDGLGEIVRVWSRQKAGQTGSGKKAKCLM